MSPERWRQIEDLYHRALELPPEARRAFLAENCRGDQSLQRRLELLLEKDASTGKVLDKPAAELLSDLISDDALSSLPAGAELGPYRIEGVLGQGGMGHVYKAHDLRLRRWVAIKVSRDRFNTRFEQEARAVAALNHPHICTLYDVGPDYLVMELVEGQTLADRIAQGKLPLEEALRIAAQIADALEYSHEQGVVHRDMKPSNVKITPTGSVKVLDFGLAKLVSGVRAQTSGSTLTLRETKPGVIMGTAAYMAPEQARGQTIDKRADIWAFGVMLYEMLTAQRPFRGDTFTDTLAAIIGSEPDWSGVPAAAQPLLQACLEKDARRRLRDIGDYKRLLTSAPEPVAAQASKRPPWIAAAIAVASGLIGWSIAARFGRELQQEQPAARFSLPPPENISYRPGSISPDGRWFAFIGVDKSGKSQLWVRRMDSGVVQPLFPAENYPFWSPDSRFIVFKQGDKLMKAELPGGTPQVICETSLAIGGSWSRQGIVLFGKGDVLLQVSASGGELKQVSRLDSARKETVHDFPVFLPDGRHFLYNIHSEKRQFSGLFLGSLDSPDTRSRLLEDISNAAYVPESAADPSAGYILFARGQALMAQRFDAHNFRLQGDAWTVLENVPRNPSNLSVSVSASVNGELAVSPTYMGEQLTWFDRTGRRLGTIGEPGLHQFPELSPDEQTVADDATDPESFAPYLWLFPIGRGSAARFTFNPSDHPVWSPDGKRIAFGLMTSALYVKTATGSENEELLLKAANISDQTAGDDYRMPCDWSRDGKSLIYVERGAKHLFDLWTLPMSGDRKPRLLLQNESNNRCGAVSPDGRWIAYSSDEQGRGEIYVQAFPAAGTLTGRKWQVSYNGGIWPRWRRDGKELFFLDAARNMVAVEVRTSPNFEHGTPQTLFATEIITDDSRYDVTADGRRFIVPAVVSTGSNPVTVIVNWLQKGGK